MSFSIFGVGNSPPSAEGIYDVTLSGARTISSTYTYPTLPQNVTNTVQVTPASWASAQAANPTNTRFELAAGSYGFFRTVGDGVNLADCEFVADTPGTVTFSEVIIANMNRCYLDGLNHTGKMAIENFGGLPAPADILINNHYGLMSAGATEASIVPQGGYQRVMMQNSTIENLNGGQFGLIGGNQGDNNSGFISANNWWYYNAVSTGPTMIRLMACDEILFVDDYVTDSRIRMHKEIDQCTIADVNIISSGGGSLFITDNIESLGGNQTNMYLERIDTYSTVDPAGEDQFSAFGGFNLFGPHTVWARNNTMYNQAYTGGDVAQGFGPFGNNYQEFTNNIKTQYVAPPTRTAGATGTGRP